ncbi:oligosaccharyltransferase delta subunit [Schizosaccharomyces cryophilus OY26]|uniref:Oligosaccharyltransferase delta subunit n=1 Tax=Schizosaccharomyces cryophilus (strain OY26 / ATCC MYA-4695 / CBS 11777 / NBRC 106824 / NRRL Y48691) TaxID=653667 RepID=S9VPY8_SCHCR|nr:oligosaccharyltransferase delta subunit [Schizosaccharomyces cryophilus OY26]EPY50023.1 oligosaccharyltransferase delta subunit [Schizosaccharomyces cryophilus OY26]
MRAISFVSLLCLFMGVFCSSWNTKDGVLKLLSPTKSLKTGSEKRFDELNTFTEIDSSLEDTLVVQFTCAIDDEAAVPHQAHIVFSDKKKPSISIVYPVKVKGNGDAVLKLPLSELPSEIVQSEDGLLSTLMIGSFGDASPSSISLGSLVFDSGSLPAFNAKTSTEAVTSPQPTILHTFAAPPKAANKFLSLLFSLAVAAVFVVLIGVWMQFSSKTSVYSVSSSSLGHFLFFISLATAEGLLFFYWTSLTIFQFIRYSVFILIAFVISAKLL